MSSARYWLALFWVAQAFAWIWTCRTLIRHGRARAWSAFLAPAAVSAIGATLVAIIEAPYSPWDVVRLAPTAAFARGFPLYSGRASGAILSTMYTPFSALAYLPAVVFRDPATQAIVGRIVACTFAFMPILLVCINHSKHYLKSLIIFTLAVLAASLSPALWYSCTRIHADAPAIGLLALACVFETSAKRSTISNLSAGLCAWLAVWSKQTMIALPIALTLWSLATLGPRAAIKRALSLAIVGACVSVIFLACFDRDAMLFNTVLWPGRFPWKGRFPSNLAFWSGELCALAAPFLIVLALTRPKFVRPSPNSRAGLLCFVALALAPLAIMARVKKGGDLNSFSATLYPLLLACVARLATLLETLEIPTRMVRVVIAVSLATATLFTVPNVARDLKLLAKARPSDAEYHYLVNHPGEIYFPWHPLAHLAAEGRPTHHLHTVKERGVAGFPVGREHFELGVPATSRYVAFPLKRFGPVAGFAWSFEQLEAEGLLDPDAKPIALNDLRDYECYRLKR